MSEYISKRGLHHGFKPFFRYIPALFKAEKDLYHPTLNPEGIIVTTLSENAQMMSELTTRLSTRPLLSPAKLLLGDYNGSTELREGIRKMVKREISCNIELQAEDIICLSGATSIMAACSCALFNPGNNQGFIDSMTYSIFI